MDANDDENALMASDSRLFALIRGCRLTALTKKMRRKHDLRRLWLHSTVTSRSPSVLRVPVALRVARSSQAAAWAATSMVTTALAGPLPRELRGTTLY